MKKISLFEREIQSEFNALKERKKDREINKKNKTNQTETKYLKEV